MIIVFSFFLFIAFEEIQFKTWDASKENVYLDELCLMAEAFLVKSSKQPGVRR